MLNKCVVCGEEYKLNHKCPTKKERRIEAGRQANAAYRGDTPPTWGTRLKYGFAMLSMDGDDVISMRS
jgi:hypothetical protein